MRYFLQYILLIAIIIISGCSMTRNVPDGESLLTNVEVVNSAKNISKDSYKPYIKQMPNVKILGVVRLHLGLYNLAGRDTSKWINKKLRDAGEAPVIYDSFLKSKSADQLAIYMHNRGYYDAVVTDSLIRKTKNKVKVTYNIDAGRQFKIKNFGVKSKDEKLQNIVVADSANSLLRSGEPFDVSLHNAERERITKMLQDKGYYGFSKKVIYFKADSTIGNYQVNDSLFISGIRILNDGKDSIGNHPVYNIRNTYFRLGIDAKEVLNNKETYSTKFDTIKYKGIYFLYANKMKVKPEVVFNSNYIVPGQLYQATLVNKTYSLLSGLHVYRYINVNFNKVVNTNSTDSTKKWLDCNIRLVPSKLQSYAVEIEGTNSSGNHGAGGNLKYQHKNIFRGAEEFDLNIGASIQNQENNKHENFTTTEFRTEAHVIFPKFWIPIKVENFRMKYNPKTSLSISYNYQKRPDYTRTIGNVKISYLWKGNKYVSHSLTPFGINYVVISDMDPQFADQIKNSYLHYSYQNHLIGGASYSFVYNGQEFGKRKDFWYTNFNFNEGGNLFHLLSNTFHHSSTDGHYKIMGIRYAQFVKGSIDIRYHHYINRVNSMACRLFIGVGYPYGNLKVLPFEERYFSGGANSLRAWPVRSLGPGSYDSKKLAFYSQVGDIKLEFNIEQRFKLIGALEGAVFLDVGNIYNIKDEKDQPGGYFEFGTFAEKLAVDTGAGIRFDLKYFILRLDTGLKLRDPVLEKGKRWIPASRHFKWDDVAFNFAIGYPF